MEPQYTKRDINKLEAVQRAATKQINGFRDLPYPERLKKLNLPTLKYRRQRGDMIEVYKILHDIYDPDCAPHLQLSDREGRSHNLKFTDWTSRALFVVKSWGDTSKAQGPKPATPGLGAWIR